MLKVKKVFLPVLIILTVFCLGLSPGSSMAVQATDNTQGIAVVLGTEAEKFVDATLHAVEEGVVENIAPVSAFDFDGSNVYTVGGGVTAVTVPLHGEYSLPSNITVFFDENDTVLQTNEMLVTKNTVGNFQVETFLDGVLTNSKDTGIAYITDEELLAEEPSGSEISPMGTGEVAACLVAAMGIGGTLAYVIAVACGTSCVAPTPVTGPICAACIGAYALLGTGTIAGAVACFNYL